jgi:hypothetical protein
MNRPSFAMISAILALGLSASCQPEKESPAGANPVEAGTVSWGRDLDAALAASKSSGKPVFLLFQEIPGCKGCKDFGREVLSDPEVVRIIEGNFVPLLVANNQPGKDEKILKRFDEPAWNYQVVRFLDSGGRDLIPRKDLVWKKPELMQRMRDALAKAGRPAPAALQRVAFSQACFWTGEKELGAIPGIFRTEAGFIDGKEVTVVDFDPRMISLDALIQAAKQAGVSDALYLTAEDQRKSAKAAGFTKPGWLGEGYRAAPASDQKRQLRGTPFAGLALTPEQATKVNAFARTDPARAKTFLTPEQRKSLD